MTIILESVSKKWSDASLILHPTSLTIHHGITSVLIGPSGCGKSTLLKLIVGLIFPTSGRILFGSEEATNHSFPSFRRKIGYVTQDGGLFPHLSAQENVILAARYFRHSPDFIEKRISELRELLRISKETCALYPAQLSGGERQRISLMRALFLNPQYLILDEPLGALDPITRYELQSHLKQIFTQLKKTVMLVTHDMKEAAYFGQEVILMRKGRVVQQSSFPTLVSSPADHFVTEFIQAQEPPKEE